MKVSVVIPTNRFRFLKEAVDSVKKQTFTDYELIISDTSPTNDTQNLVKTLTDVRYYKKRDTGINDNWRVAINYAKGQYIALFSDDDLWEPQFLEETVKILDEKSNIGVVCVHNSPFYEPDYKGSVRVFDDSFYRLFKGDKEMDGHDCIRSYMDSKIIFRVGLYSTMLIRKKCYDEFGYTTLKVKDLQKVGWVGIDTLARFFSKWDFYYIDKPLCRWRVWDGQDTARLRRNRMIRKVLLAEPKKESFVKYLKKREIK